MVETPLVISLMKAASVSLATAPLSSTANKLVANAPLTFSKSSIVMIISNRHAVLSAYDPRQNYDPRLTQFRSVQIAVNQDGRALRAILAQARACSAVRADTVCHAVPANRRRLLSSAPERDPTKGSDETNPTFRFVSACATPSVSDPQDRLRRLLRFHVRTGSVQTPHGPDE